MAGQALLQLPLGADGPGGSFFSPAPDRSVNKAPARLQNYFRSQNFS
jgi:hypothetical protein